MNKKKATKLHKINVELTLKATDRVDAIGKVNCLLGDCPDMCWFLKDYKIRSL